ncbi:DUF7010 family protein [Streptomyces griseus]|uniref:DUF7010 family protein n=1 Tax=Streptomyces griseus TaxID=1911 RepID=UPI0004C680C2|nr:hypothetical protein [Streptomyces griseus]
MTMTTDAEDAECLALTRTLRRRGVVVLSVFGVVWALAGGSGLPSPGLAVAGGLGALLAAGTLVAGRRAAGEVTRPVRLPERWNRGVGVVNAAEAAAIVGVVAGANASGHPEWIPVGICLAVGLHFFPLARLYDQRQYGWVAAVLTALAAIGGGLLAGGLSAEAVRAVVGLPAALALWGTALLVARD